MNDRTVPVPALSTLKKICFGAALIFGLSLGVATSTANAAKEKISCDSNGKQQSINGTTHTCGNCTVNGTVTRVWYVGALDAATAESTCLCQHDASYNCSAQSLQIIEDTFGPAKLDPIKQR